MLGIASATLRDWKCHRVGPPYIQLSARCVRYIEADILKFAADRRVVPVVKALGGSRHTTLSNTKGPTRW